MKRKTTKTKATRPRRTAVRRRTASSAPRTAQPASGWRERLARELPLMGHRNWIVIADAAYPAQCRPGIETIDTGTDQIRVVQTVLDMLDRSQHVRPIIHLDLELMHVSEELAPGINAYRTALDAILNDRTVQSVPHEELIARLDKAGEVFRVLVLKTTLTLPYTSVFAQLDCGYWSAESEARLRRVMQGGL